MPSFSYDLVTEQWILSVYFIITKASNYSHYYIDANISVNMPHKNQPVQC